ncbi:DinB family protein [uncultured Roseivirga sp.]|uniref:DinB family protein n=1 Tax=uncultured Roseivirga sp. TaxID=543088 RepID=UPI000D7B5336|nr:DinB family protein [uncultured Roseivirga sp.]PWL29863.1 MAG: damage-inducible protein DinB [Roseivirga sp. XM-24bin3]
MKEHYTRLFEYNLWANKEFSEAVRVNPFENQKILKLISHIANAQVIWLSRLKKEETSVGVWDEHEVHEALDMLESSSQDWLDYIYSEELEENVSYKNSKGEEFENMVSDILTHVVNHGTHTRGQIAYLLREEDIDPPACDFIFYTRT